MSKDLTIKNHNLPAPAITTNIGEQKINKFNIKDSRVSFNVILPEVQNQNELLLAVSRFSNQYYQLFVTAEDIFTEAGKSITVSTDRALIKAETPDEIYRQCSSLSPDGIELLKTIPAIIVTEKAGKYYSDVDPNQQAAYGYVTNVKKQGKQIKVYYQTIGLFPLQVLCENPGIYAVNVSCAISDFNKPGWTVKKNDLFMAFQNTGITSVPMPM